MPLKLDTFLRETYSRRNFNLGPNTIAALQRTINVYSHHLGRDCLLSDLEFNRILGFLAARLQSCARKTVRQDRGNLLVLWAAAHAWGMHSQPPVKIDTIRLPKKVPRAWTLSQMESLLATCITLSGNMRELPIRKADWWTSLILFLYDSGARMSAALSVEPGGMSLTKRTCMLSADADKSWSERVVRFSRQTAAAIEKVYDPHGQVVWPYPWHRRKVWLDLKEIMAEAGIAQEQYVGFHRFRKTHATQTVIAAGWEAARQSLGHSSLKITEQYVDVTQVPQNGVQLPRPKLDAG